MVNQSARKYVTDDTIGKNVFDSIVKIIELIQQILQSDFHIGIIFVKFLFRSGLIL